MYLLCKRKIKNAKMQNYLLTALFLFSTLVAVAQEQFVRKEESIFRPALILGFNASQVDGDNIAGYRKFGLNAGAAAFIRLPKNFTFNFEILFSQKGARNSPNQAFMGEPFRLMLDYVDVPFVFNYHDRNSQGNDVAIFGIGVVFTSLVRYKEFRGGREWEYPEGSPYNRLGAEALANLTFVIRQHFGINLRYMYSMTNIVNRKMDFSAMPNQGQRNNYLSLRFMYLF